MLVSGRVDFPEISRDFRIPKTLPTNVWGLWGHIQTHRLLSTIQASIVDATWQPSNTGYCRLLHEVHRSQVFLWVFSVGGKCEKCRQIFRIMNEKIYMMRVMMWLTWIWSWFVGWLVLLFFGSKFNGPLGVSIACSFNHLKTDWYIIPKQGWTSVLKTKQT